MLIIRSRTLQIDDVKATGRKLPIIAFEPNQVIKFDDQMLYVNWQIDISSLIVAKYVEKKAKAMQ